MTLITYLLLGLIIPITLVAVLLLLLFSLNRKKVVAQTASASTTPPKKREWGSLLRTILRWVTIFSIILIVIWGDVIWSFLSGFDWKITGAGRILAQEVGPGWDNLLWIVLIVLVLLGVLWIFKRDGTGKGDTIWKSVGEKLELVIFIGFIIMITTVAWYFINWTNAPTYVAATRNVHPLCKDGDSGILPDCKVIEISAVGTREYAPPGTCLNRRPGGVSKITPLPEDGPGWWLLTSQDGSPKTIAVYHPKVGRSYGNSPICRY